MDSEHAGGACNYDLPDDSPKKNAAGGPAKASEGGFKGELLETALVAICWYVASAGARRTVVRRSQP